MFDSALPQPGSLTLADVDWMLRAATREMFLDSWGSDERYSESLERLAMLVQVAPDGAGLDRWLGVHLHREALKAFFQLHTTGPTIAALATCRARAIADRSAGHHTLSVVLDHLSGSGGGEFEAWLVRFARAVVADDGPLTTAQFDGALAAHIAELRTIDNTESQRDQALYDVVGRIVQHREWLSTDELAEVVATIEDPEWRAEATLDLIEWRTAPAVGLAATWATVMSLVDEVDDPRDAARLRARAGRLHPDPDHSRRLLLAAARAVEEWPNADHGPFLIINDGADGVVATELATASASDPSLFDAAVYVASIATNPSELDIIDIASHAARTGDAVALGNALALIPKRLEDPSDRAVAWGRIAVDLARREPALSAALLAEADDAIARCRDPWRADYARYRIADAFLEAPDATNADVAEAVRRSAQITDGEEWLGHFSQVARRVAGRDPEWALALHDGFTRASRHLAAASVADGFDTSEIALAAIRCELRRNRATTLTRRLIELTSRGDHALGVVRTVLDEAIAIAHNDVAALTEIVCRSTADFARARTEWMEREPPFDVGDIPTGPAEDGDGDASDDGEQVFHRMRALFDVPCAAQVLVDWTIEESERDPSRRDELIRRAVDELIRSSDGSVGIYEGAACALLAEYALHPQPDLVVPLLRVALDGLTPRWANDPDDLTPFSVNGEERDSAERCAETGDCSLFTQPFDSSAGALDFFVRVTQSTRTTGRDTAVLDAAAFDAMTQLLSEYDCELQDGDLSLPLWPLNG